MRARIVLSCSGGLSNGEVARRLGITGATVCKWRERFRTQRLEGLLDEPRPGAPRSIIDAQVEEVITRTLESMPANRHPLEHATDGAQDRPFANGHRADLASLRIATVPGLRGGARQVQARP
jgi:transposase-like protein